jgi:hypothetical protein
MGAGHFLPSLLSPPAQYALVLQNNAIRIWARQRQCRSRVDAVALECLRHDRPSANMRIWRSQIQILPVFAKCNNASENWETSGAQGKLHRDSLHFITTSSIEERERALVAAVPICLSAHCLDSRIEAIIWVRRLLIYRFGSSDSPLGRRISNER